MLEDRGTGCVPRFSSREPPRAQLRYSDRCPRAYVANCEGLEFGGSSAQEKRQQQEQQVSALYKDELRSGYGPNRDPRNESLPLRSIEFLTKSHQSEPHFIASVKPNENQLTFLLTVVRDISHGPLRKRQGSPGSLPTLDSCDKCSEVASSSFAKPPLLVARELVAIHAQIRSMVLWPLRLLPVRSVIKLARKTSKFRELG